MKNKGEFRLHNPIKEQELLNDLVRAEQAEQTLEAKQVEQTAENKKVRQKRGQEERCCLIPRLLKAC